MFILYIYPPAKVDAEYLSMAHMLMIHGESSINYIQYASAVFCTNQTFLQHRHTDTRRIVGGPANLLTCIISRWLG